MDADAPKVITETKELYYDYLVIATGPYLAFEQVPGLGPDKGHTECIFTLDQAERAKKGAESVKQAARGETEAKAVATEGAALQEPATKAEARPLLTELRRIGYRPRVLKRASRRHHDQRLQTARGVA